jgi:hypothetical protein
MLPKIFLFFLCDTRTGNCYYIDANGNIKTASIQAGIDVALKQSPDGWLNAELGFIRNATYYGINRSYSQPLKFVKDAAKIVRSLSYGGKGIETPLTLVILKYNETPQPNEPLYKLYYRGQLDLTKATDIVAEGIEANLMEGGVVQLLKSYENVTFQIPCDGSIVENVKVDCDGLYLPDSLHYNIIGIKPPQAGQYILPITFINNDGDNFGIIKKDQQLEQDTNQAYYATSENFVFMSVAPIRVRVKGQISIKPFINGSPQKFALALRTNKMVGVNPHTVLLLPNDGSGIYPNYVFHGESLDSEKIFYFDNYIDLDANEKLFISLGFQGSGTNIPTINSGSIDISFSSKAQPSAPWCIAAFDLFKLIVQKICSAASTTNQLFNYGVDSTLLQQNLNLLVTSGDALRASGDANYQKYFQAVQINPNTPSNNLVQIYGPTIKTSLQDFYKSFAVILFGALGNQTLTGANETLFFERMDYVFNPSNNTFNIGEVANMKVKPASDLIPNEIAIGYEGQNYDQKAGKYEYNQLAQFVAPIKTLQKKLELVSRYRTDSYGIERLRSNIESTSTTRNSNDNSVFVINADRTQSSFDSEVATFKALINDFDNANNTNIRFKVNQSAQGIAMQNVIGSYFSMLNDPSIFVFAYRGFSQTIPLVFTFSGNLIGNPANALTGTPADYITINFYLNGVKQFTQTYTATSASTAFSGSYTLPLIAVLKENDCVYATAQTSVNGYTDNMAADIKVGTTGSYWTASGTSIAIGTGSANQLIAMPNVTAPLVNGMPVVSYGFQYFQFNSILINSNFDVAFSAFTIIQGAVNETLKYNYFKNGSIVTSDIKTSTGHRELVLSNIANNDTFALGDIVFFLGDCSNLSAQVSSVQISFTSTFIKKFKLKRVQYQSLKGVPNILTNTVDAGAPYNIEDLTPKRLFNKWQSWFAGLFYGQQPNNIQFATLSKNQYLSTIINNNSIVENNDVPVSALGNPLFLPYYFEFDFKVPLNFADLLTGMANAHVQFTYNGISFYGFPMDIKQKPALNEKQTGKLICSPLTNIQNLINIDFDGLNFINMPPNSLFCPYLSPVQFVPEGEVLPAKYHNKDMNMFWFSEQVFNWCNQRNHWQPFQVGDLIPLQFQTNGLSPVTAYLYNSQGSIIQTVVLTQKASAAIVTGYYLWEGTIDLTTVTPGSYYIYIDAASTAFFISDGLLVSADCTDSLLFEYSHSSNKQAMIFDTGFTSNIRVKGFFNNRFKPKYKGAFFVDQPQDISILNAIPYSTRELWIGLDDGVPDYVIQKISRIMLLDTVFIDGVQYSLDDGAEWEEVFIEGNPKKYWKTTLRLSKNVDGVTVTNAGATNNTNMITTVDANAFGPNAGNASNTTTPLITNITV